MNHEQVRERLAALALGALDAREMEQVSEHLDTCRDCSRIARGDLGVAVHLGRFYPAAIPPAALRARILAAASRVPVRETAARAAPPKRLALRWPALGWAAAASVAIGLFAAVLTFQVSNQQQLRDLERANDRLGGSLAQQSVVLNDARNFNYLLALPGINKVVLAKTDKAPGSRGLIVTNRPQEWGVVLLLGMDPLKSGEVYQIWLSKGADVTSAGTIAAIDELTGYGQVYLTAFPKTLPNFTKVFVTLESAPGAKAPTGPELLVAPLLPPA